MIDAGDARSPYSRVLLAVLVCDRKIIEAGTSKISLIGLFTRVPIASYLAPLTHAVFARFADAAGVYALRLELIDLSSNASVSWREYEPYTVTDRLEQYEFTADITAVIPHPGSYEYRLYANDDLLGQTRFIAMLAAADGRRTDED
jgi:hypothetical protein